MRYCILYSALRYFDALFNTLYIIESYLSKLSLKCIKCINSKYNTKLKFCIIDLTCQILMHYALSMVEDIDFISAFNSCYNEVA